MTTMGIFAGRGDVLVAMGLALVIGVWVGWKARQFANWMKSKIK